MSRLSRRSFLAASAMLAAGPAFGAPRKQPTPAPVPEVGRSGSVDVVIVGAGAAGIAAARRLAAAGRRFALVEAADRSAGAASPTPRPSGCRTIAARTGSTPPTSIRWRSSRRRPGSTSIRRRPASACASARRYRARRRDGGFSRRARARQRRHRGCRARQERRLVRAGAAEGSRRTGARRSSSCSDRTAAARISPMSRRSTSPRSPSATSTRSAARASARWSPSSPPACRCSCATPATQIEWSSRANVSRSTTARRPVRRARRHRHGVDQRAHRRQDQVRARAAEAPARRRRQAHARQPTTTWRSSSPAIRSGCAATSWCSRKRAARRTAALFANVSGTHALHDRRRRQVRRASCPTRARPR